LTMVRKSRADETRRGSSTGIPSPSVVREPNEQATIVHTHTHGEHKTATIKSITAQ
jgi:hypothetical protein